MSSALWATNKLSRFDRHLHGLQRWRIGDCSDRHYMGTWKAALCVGCPGRQEATPLKEPSIAVKYRHIFNRWLSQNHVCEYLTRNSRSRPDARIHNTLILESLHHTAWTPDTRRAGLTVWWCSSEQERFDPGCVRALVGARVQQKCFLEGSRVVRVKTPGWETVLRQRAHPTGSPRMGFSSTDPLTVVRFTLLEPLFVPLVL